MRPTCAPPTRMSTKTPPDGRDTAAPRGTTRQRLFDATLSLIAEQGYDATTVDEIAEQAGVAKGTVYYNFGCKEKLYTALLEWGITRLADTLREAIPPPEEGVDAHESLIRVLRAGVVFVGKHEALARMLMAEVWRTNRAWHETVRQLHGEAVEVVTGQLERLAEQGRLRPGLDTELAGTALFGMVVTVALSRSNLRPELPVEDIQATLAHMTAGLVVP